ncbi:MAG: RdgB/HAM1 family non-canonical purine NTP pyrophosphatase [Gammaproteobacteria bacterium]|nr:RdgB/HAM1 family non-canonical purine NTP pyrophosphatase [Gammaproteobacteria bacterium]MDE0251990.1 RdgB/HAM1 family non-canonical purine NTP pyrophosphatase [Gammaproteobacteria bacterium]MDE0402902.1 RdgB/HAM1 family non-canonical purine NTP pyrophosphatase [Gammaproteobacteria bacterium]
MQTVVVATHNDNKVRELTTLLRTNSFQLVSLKEFSIPSVEETGSTFRENALLKAEYATKHTNLPAIADDSGLSVDVLGGEPGVRSARYAGESATDAENVQLLLERLTDKRVNNSPISASFHCVLVFMQSSSDLNPIITSGKWCGLIVEAPRGNSGFGYDPIFQPLGSSKTAAELAPELKNQISHRGRAVVDLKSQLLTRFA